MSVFLKFFIYLLMMALFWGGLTVGFCVCCLSRKRRTMIWIGLRRLTRRKKEEVTTVPVYDEDDEGMPDPLKFA